MLLKNKSWPSSFFHVKRECSVRVYLVVRDGAYYWKKRNIRGYKNVKNVF